MPAHQHRRQQEHDRHGEEPERKDEYDRVNNEASYLATMNAARSDKSRMLDYAVPGRIVSRLLHPDRELLDAIGDRLNCSTRPALVVGPGVDRNGAWDQVVALAERHEALVWVSPMSSRCSFPERHRLYAGF